MKKFLLNYFSPSGILQVVLLVLLFFTCPTAKASECYNYHTSITHKIIVKNNNIYYQLTEKDPNGFSYVRQENKLLIGIDKNSFKVIGEDESTFMFADKNGFYLMPKNEQYEKNTASYSKILGPTKNIKHINGRLFLINLKWTYFDGWQNNITKIVLNELPINISNIKSYSNGFYLKSNKEVFMVKIDFDTDKKYKIEVVPSINALKTVYYACNQNNNEDFIADEQYIYAIRREGDFTDITPQFRALKVQGKFNSLKLIDANIPMWRDGQKIIKKREGHTTNGRNPFTGEEISMEYSYSTSKPLLPEFGKVPSYIFFGNKIYPIWEDDYSQAYDVKTDASKLRAIEGKLFRGDDFYYFEADNDYKIISTNIPSDAKFFPGVYSYGNYLPKALVSDNYIHFIGDRFSIHLDNKKKLTSKIVKQLGMFYLYNNALFDGEKSYPITADYETLSYLGSFVEVINDCAGEIPNTPQVAVKYHHFFKDEDAVYYFDEKTKKLQTIQTANPSDFNADNYEAIQELYKIKDVKGAIKKKTRTGLNYYIIGGCVLAFLGFGFYLFKRKK
ncbi:hypothetical protein J2X31_003618 [Flavobacterium arsenatis]|uniref:DKNYY family protein n=1 Tax=Flavobacterium arsenatis TaxID=1484332 RepID=A0ABU1TUN3_9FLAO|nr:hypothetical protein [Flavobacterium arsenatis]MDR6969585.1 hypothetical protein [Flavobacterium arsenatis]